MSPDKELESALAAARPTVPATFTDDVMRRIALAPIVESTPRLRLPLVLAGAVAVATIAVLLVFGRREAAPEHEPTPSQPAWAPPAAPPPTPPPTREMADLRELVESVERPPHHATETKFARCSWCHTHRPQRNTTNSRGVPIIAYFDLEGGDARVIVRELEVLAIALGDRVTVDVKLVSPDGVRMSTLAAMAAEKRGKLWRMLELIAGGTDRSAATLERHARELKIDPRELAGAPDTPPVIDPKKAKHTPTRFDVDGVMISGPRALRELRARVIERAAALP